MRVGKKLRNKNGFTLIELIAVIFIMGIMLILSLPQVSKIQQANKNMKHMRSLSSEEQNYIQTLTLEICLEITIQGV